MLFGGLFLASAAVIATLLWSLWKRSRLLLSELSATADAFDKSLAPAPKGRTMNSGHPS